MNVMTFLLLSIIVHAIPIPYRPGMLSPRALIRWLPLRLIWGTVAWVIICILSMMALPWAIIGLLMSFGVLLIFSGGFRPGGRIEDFMEGLRLPFVCIGFIIVLVIPAFTGIITWTSDVANAQTVDEFITEEDGMLFNNPIPDDRVRLVTSTYASFVARKFLSSIGSNVEIAASHITTREGRLVWVCVVVSTNVLSENFIQGLVVVDANNPSLVDVITDVQIPVGEGLFWDRNIQFGNYLQDMTSAYEYAYPTWDPAGNLVYVQTRTQLGWDFVERPLGPKVYCENGTIRAYATLADTPDWITQAYSEEWLERQINRWGGYRRGEGFDLFAGGFLWLIQASRDRLTMTEDTRYILNPDTNRVEALVALHPPDAASLTLSGLMRGTQEGIYYYDMSDLSFVSGEAAVNEVIKQFPQPVTGSYYGAMPLLYPVQINSTHTRQAWYCPIYWYDSTYSDEAEAYEISDFRLHAFGIVDAQEEGLSFTQAKGTTSNPDLVTAVREGYIQEVESFLGFEEEPS
ncbi:hypothetical protein EU520_01530, partial [Candidatus Thorarchaeota archaeon]